MGTIYHIGSGVDCGCCDEGGGGGPSDACCGSVILILTVEGVQNGDCSECDGFNGEFTLSWDGVEWWNSSELSICRDVGNRPRWSFYCEPGVSFVVVYAEVDVNNPDISDLTVRYDIIQGTCETGLIGHINNFPTPSKCYWPNTITISLP